jgi:hypothetical protein
LPQLKASLILASNSCIFWNLFKIEPPHVLGMGISFSVISLHERLSQLLIEDDCGNFLIMQVDSYLYLISTNRKQPLARIHNIATASCALFKNYWICKSERTYKIHWTRA